MFETGVAHAPKYPAHRFGRFGQSAFCKILADHWQHFLQVYEERFERTCGKLRGVVLHHEVAEKLWWIQGQPYLLLGSTGTPLPVDVVQRPTAYVEAFVNGLPVQGESVLIRPQMDCVILGITADDISAALGQKLSGVDATYLSQVANYLAQHLSVLDVVGRTYSVYGVGGLIDEHGRWVGALPYRFPVKMIGVHQGSVTQGTSTGPQ